MIVESKKAGELLAVAIRLSEAMQRDEKEGILIRIGHKKESINGLGIRELYLDPGFRFKNKRNSRSQNWVKNYTLEFKQ